ncbi:MAG: CRTAC1 family protein [Vicinamibacteraceae bacterium]
MTLSLLTRCAAAAALLVGIRPLAANAPPFREAAREVGLAFTHVNGASGEYYMPEVMGAGAALFDYDNDGDLDVYAVQGLDDLRSRSAGAVSRLFRNDLTSANGRRTLRFTDVTKEAGTGLAAYGMGTAVGDYDNDGHLDLYVTTFGSNVLYRNDGDGTFTDVTKTAGVDDPRWSASAAFLDYDRDGDLDLFVANYVDFTIASNKICYESLGARDYCGPRAYNPVPSRLFRNDGDGTFTDVTEASGVASAFGRGLGVATGDYDGDGWIDIYVANDASPNQLWMNRADGTFEDDGLLSGTAVSGDGRPEGSMGIASADYDADGDEDLLVTNLTGETFVIYTNEGEGNFEDSRRAAGLAAPTAKMTGFGTDWIDYDSDGRLDLFVANGAVNVIGEQRGQPQPFRQRNQLFHQEERGRLKEVTAEAGPALAPLEVGRGAAFGDIDNDGDVDILVTNNAGPLRLLLNEARGDRHWLSVRLDNGARNRWGVGARVGVTRQGRPTLWRRVRSDGSYLSASDLRVHVGLGADAAIGAVLVEWPDGSRERWTDVAADRLVVLTRGKGSPPDR